MTVLCCLHNAVVANFKQFIWLIWKNMGRVLVSSGLMLVVGMCACSRFFQKICQHRGKAGDVSQTLLTAVKSHVATENNAVMIHTYYAPAPVGEAGH